MGDATPTVSYTTATTPSGWIGQTPGTSGSKLVASYSDVSATFVQVVFENPAGSGSVSLKKVTVSVIACFKPIETTVPPSTPG